MVRWKKQVDGMFNILSEEGNNRCRASVDEAAGSGAGTAMVDDGRHPLEQPFWKCQPE
jgi:hypothetical protein